MGGRPSVTGSPFPFVEKSVVMIMLSIGRTDYVALYDFCVLVENIGVMLDPESELGKAFEQVRHDAWEQLPTVVTMDFTSDD